jgi:hypothetical protein
MIRHLFVIPANAGIQTVFGAKRIVRNWIPAFAGMTEDPVFYRKSDLLRALPRRQIAAPTADQIN